MQLTLNWAFVSDTVMGGISRGSVQPASIDGEQGVRLVGHVSLENNGGFIQMAADLDEGSAVFDASAFTGIWLRVTGNGERYNLRLRTDALTRPWQSFRAEFVAPARWDTLQIPFSAFDPHRTTATFDPARLRRVGVLAIGRAFEADVTVAGFGFY